MNVLTRSILAILAGITALLCTACSDTPTNSVPDSTEYSFTTTTTTAATTTAHETIFTAAADSSALPADTGMTGSFRSGVWLAKDHNTEAERFFVFLDDTHGKVIEQQNGQETGFTCVLSEDTTTFQFGAEDEKPVTVYWADDDHAVFVWGEEKSESLSFLRENGSEPLHFFTNEQLCAMALEHYAAQNGKRPEHAQAFYNLDEMIAIQLYDGEGDASSTYDWYTVDRYTGEGYNTLNETIRLAGNPAETAPAQTSVPATTTIVPQTTTILPPATTVTLTLPAPMTDVQAETGLEDEMLPETTEDWGW